MKVFIMCVGTRDPWWVKDPQEKKIEYLQLKRFQNLSYNKKEGPILSFLKAFGEKIDSEDKLYLISTAPGKKVKQPTRENAEDLCQILFHEKKYFKKENIHHWQLEGINPSDIEELLPEMKKKLLKIMEENEEATEFIINSSPGTPQMKAAWFTFFNAGLFKRANLLEVVEDEPTTIRQPKVEALFENEFIRVALSLFEKHLFWASSEVFKELCEKTIFSERRERFRFCRDLMNSYAKWYHFEYEEALKDIEFLKSEYKGILEASLNEILESQINELKQIRSNDKKALNFYVTAELDYESGNYIGCIWRSASVHEVVMIKRAIEIIESQTGIRLDPDKFKESIESMPNESRNALDNLLKQYFPRSYPKHLPLGIAHKIVKDQGKAYNPKLDKDAEELKEKRDKVLHAGEKISKEDAEKALSIAKRVLQSENIHVSYKNYPFSIGRFKEVKELLSFLLLK